MNLMILSRYHLNTQQALKMQLYLSHYDIAGHIEYALKCSIRFFIEAVYSHRMTYRLLWMTTCTYVNIPQHICAIGL